MGKSKRPTISQLLNDLTFKTIYLRIKNLALNMFEWEGLPEGLRPEYIERVLYHEGQALFFKDDKMGIFCLPCQPSGGVNIYNEHMDFYAVGFNYHKKYSLDQAVLIKNNMLMTNTDDQVMIYANKIADIERSFDVNIRNQKFPFIIKCNDKDELTFKNIYYQIDGNEPVVYTDKNLDLDSIDVLPTIAPFVADKLADSRHDIWNEVLTYLGINNANTDKKERLVSDEVNSNNEFVRYNAEYMLQTRQYACDQINEMFGLNISVKRRVIEDGTIHLDDQGNPRE
jgi:hypothetical protein